MVATVSTSPYPWGPKAETESGWQNMFTQAWCSDIAIHNLKIHNLKSEKYNQLGVTSLPPLGHSLLNWPPSKSWRLGTGITSWQLLPGLPNPPLSEQPGTGLAPSGKQPALLNWGCKYRETNSEWGAGHGWELTAPTSPSQSPSLLPLLQPPSVCVLVA